GCLHFFLTSIEPPRCIEEKPGWLPGFHIFQLIRKNLRVPSQVKCFIAEDGRTCMMAVGRTRRSVIEPVHDDIRSYLTNGPHDIVENLFFVPDPKRFIGMLGIAKIDRSGKPLISSIDSPGSQEFLCPDHAE